VVRPNQALHLTAVKFVVGVPPVVTPAAAELGRSATEGFREDAMRIRRIVPNIVSAAPDLCRDFYADFLGLRVAMDMGWIATYVSPDNPTAQVSVVRGDPTPAAKQSVSLSIEVADVERLHREAVTRGYPILYPLTDEPWGVRRFHVADPNGVVVNLMCHLPGAATD
jgi:predicted enzyme related to lactoylglutathione lyase